MMPICAYKRCRRISRFKLNVDEIEFFHPYVCRKHYLTIARLLGFPRKGKEKDMSKKLKKFVEDEDGLEVQVK